MESSCCRREDDPKEVDPRKNTSSPLTKKREKVCGNRKEKPEKGQFKKEPSASQSDIQSVCLSEAKALKKIQFRTHAQVTTYRKALVV